MSTLRTEIQSGVDLTIPDVVCLISGETSYATAYKGQIFSYSRKGVEFMHGGGKPEDIKDEHDKKGWPNSEISMFPVIGSTDGVVLMDGNNEKHYPMGGKHGISRHLPWGVKTGRTLSSVVFVQYHNGKSLIRNTRYHPDKPENGPEYFEWPFEFNQEKSVELTPTELRFGLTLTNLSNQQMPHRRGFHPAFKTQGPINEGEFIVSGIKIPLEKIVEASQKGAYPLPGVSNVYYRNKETGHGFLLYSNAPGVVLWSPGIDSGMFCIEPVSHMTKPVKPYFVDIEEHSVLLPGESDELQVRIVPYKMS